MAGCIPDFEISLLVKLTINDLFQLYTYFNINTIRPSEINKSYISKILQTERLKFQLINITIFNYIFDIIDCQQHIKKISNSIL